jgi:microcystin-dependent protein
MSQPFLGEIRAWACNFAPAHWAFCQGQILPIQQYSALFSLLGTYYGGNGTTNFGLPDLQGRVPLGYGTSNIGNVYDIGQPGGVEQVRLQTSEMPRHTHTVGAQTAVGGHSTPSDGSALAQNGKGSFYAADASAQTQLNPGTVSPYTGGNLPHSNVQPYQAINWCIALSGIFPSRN